METAPDDPVGLPDLPDRAPALPVLRRQGGVRFCDINHNWRQHKRDGPPVHGREAGRGRARGAGDHRPLRHRPKRARPTRSPAARSRARSTASPRPTSTAATPRRSRSASPAAGSARSSRRRCRRTTCSASRTTGSRSTTRTTRCGTSGCSSSSAPGKERYVGREEWHRRILDAAEVFGARYVIPNFVAGVEMAKPFGFATVDEAIASHHRGPRLLHEPRDHAALHHLVPRADDAARPRQPGGRAARVPHPAARGLPRRRSRGTASSRRPATASRAPGNAVFSVSSFMDTLAPEEVTSRRRSPHEPHLGRRGARALADAQTTRSCARSRRPPARRCHEPDRATYMVMRIINYTNVCVAQCDYCAFYVLPEPGRRLRALARGRVREDRRAARGRRRPRRVQRRLQPEAAARLLLRPLRRGARALRRPGRVLRAHDRRVRLPRRPGRTLATRRRRRGCATRASTGSRAAAARS